MLKNVSRHQIPADCIRRRTEAKVYYVVSKKEADNPVYSSLTVTCLPLTLEQTV